MATTWVRGSFGGVLGSVVPCTTGKARPCAVLQPQHRHLGGTVRGSRRQLGTSGRLHGGVAASASRGFGTGTGTQKAQKVPEGYKKVADVSALEGRQSKAVELGTLSLILFSFEGEIYCTEANSTAYKFPLIDAPITKDEATQDLVIETPLDGTTYNLKTGAVIEWCPKNNFLRNFLGGLKEKEAPVALKTYPVVIGTDGAIYTSIRSGAEKKVRKI